MSFQEHVAVQVSLARVHPRMRAGWLRERGLDDSYYTTFHRPESAGLRCIGRWPWGRSWELAGKDTFLYLGSGSGVRILSIADSVHPRMLGQINARGLVSQVVVRDSLLFVACGSWGAQVYSVSDPANPRELGSMDAVIGDLCVQDTFCYAVGGGSFRIYNCAKLTQPLQVSAVGDGGDVLAETNGHVYVGHGSSGSGLNVYDVHDPASPNLVNTLGGVQLAMFTRGHWLFRISEQPAYFSILDVSVPTSIHEVGRIDGYGGVAMYADDKYAYLSGVYEHAGLFVVDISDSSHPQLRDSINPVGVAEWDPYVPRSSGYGYLADDYGGLVVLDMHDVDNISESWLGYRADHSVDIAVDNGRAYIADHWVGAQIVDVSDPTKPVSLSVYDTSDSRGTNAVAARDSFAFVGMSGAYGRRSLRVLDVTDPSNATLAAEDSCHGWPQDFVLRDSLLYMVEAYRFQIFNVARPREPKLVGSCALQEDAYGLCLFDSIAYAASYPFAIINVSQPSNPVVVGNIWRGAWNGTVRDTFLFLSSGGILVYSVAQPDQPRLLDSLSVGPNTYWVEAVGTLLYTGNRDGVRVVDAADVHDMRVRGFCPTPYTVNRLTHQSPYIYAACWEAGVCVLESTQVGIDDSIVYSQRSSDVSVAPNPGIDCIMLRWHVDLDRGSAIVVRDIAGREVMRPDRAAIQDQSACLRVTGLPPGVYFAEVAVAGRRESVKFVKQ